MSHAVAEAASSPTELAVPPDFPRNQLTRDHNEFDVKAATAPKGRVRTLATGYRGPVRVEKEGIRNPVRPLGALQVWVKDCFLFVFDLVGYVEVMQLRFSEIII